MLKIRKGKKGMNIKDTREGKINEIRRTNDFQGNCFRNL